MSNILEYIKENITNDIVINGIHKSRPKLQYGIKEFLGNTNISQSQSIRFGNYLEKYLQEAIINSPNITDLNINNVVVGGKKIQMDIRFLYKDKVYYYELKTNLNLDTEKSSKTIEKINLVKEKLSELYTNHEVFVSILSPWYKYENNMSIKIDLSHITFMGDFLEMIGENVSETDYDIFRYSIGEEIFG